MRTYRFLIKKNLINKYIDIFIDVLYLPTAGYSSVMFFTDKKLV